jgi:hypothetical protein
MRERTGVLRHGLAAVVVLGSALAAIGLVAPRSVAADGTPPAPVTTVFGCVQSNEGSTYTVPAGMHFLVFEAAGGVGGFGLGGPLPGSGAQIVGAIAVEPGEVLGVWVGCSGNNGGWGYGQGGTGGTSSGGGPGFNGGGSTALLPLGAGAGTAAPIVVAGGGGGEGNSGLTLPGYPANGGAGAPALSYPECAGPGP